MSGDTPATFSQLDDIFRSLLQAAIPFAGIVMFVVLVVGGFKYITSSGDAQKTAGAKNAITYAIIGIIVVALAFLIIQVISLFTGQDSILNFQVVAPTAVP